MKHPTELPLTPSGNSAETNWFRNLIRCIRERSIKVGPGLRAKYGVNETIIELATRPVAGIDGESELVRVVIDEVNDDSLTCYRVDGEDERIGDPFLVAKPESLRITTYNGESTDVFGPTFTFSYQDDNERRLSDGTRYFDDALWPPYLPNDFIYIMEPTPGTGLVDINTGNPITWLDMNVSSRQFRPKMTLIAVCVNVAGVDTVQYMYIAGGPAQA